MERKWLAMASAAYLAAGCAWVRVSGHPEAQAPVQRLAASLFYADLGPESIEVSNYPTQQKYNYALFKQACSRCHTLARAINSPAQSRMYWHYHIARMSLHSRLSRQGPIPSEKARAILDFLEYDSKVRKIQDKKRFEEQTGDLKRRFELILEGALDRMQNGERLLPP